MTIRAAAQKGGITVTSIYNYEKNGHLQFVEMPDGIRVVYYRDVLRAAWLAKQCQFNGGRKPRKVEEENES